MAQHEEYINYKVQTSILEFGENAPGTFYEKLIGLIVHCRVETDREQEFKDLKQLVEENFDQILKEVNSRWLLSIVDTYADCGTNQEISNATLISYIVGSTRVMQSYVQLCDEPEEFDPDYLKDLRQSPLWDGFLTFNFLYDDTMRNAFRRIHASLRSTPLLHAIFLELLQRMLDNDSILAKLCNIHGANYIHINNYPENIL